MGVALIKEAPIQRLAFAVQPGRLPVAEVDFVAAGTAAVRADRTAAVNGVGSPPTVIR